MRAWGSPDEDDERGITPVLGIALLLGIVAVGSMAILFVAGTSLDYFQTESEQDRIEQAFTELSQVMGEAAADGDTTKSMNLDLGDQEAVAYRNESRITIYGGTGGDRELTEVRFGYIEWEGDDGSKVAFEGGAVFRDTGDETIPISSPTVHYSSGDREGTETFTYRLLEMSEEGAISSGELSLDQQIDPEAFHDVQVLENEIVRIEVESFFYKGWESYFRTHVSDAVRAQSCEDVPDKCMEHDRGNPDKGVTTVWLGEHLIQNPFENAITSTGNVTGSGSAEIDGDVAAEGEVDEDLDANVSGTEWEEDVTIDAGTLDDDIADKLDEFSDSTPLMEQYDDPEPVELHSDDYIADGDWRVEKETILNLSEGDINIAVEGDMVMDDSPITIVPDEAGDNTVMVFLNGSLEDFRGGTDILIEDDDGNTPGPAEHFQIYGTSNFTFYNEPGAGNVIYNGVVYAPEGELDAAGNLEIIGSLVLGDTHISGTVEVDHDRDLIGVDSNLGDFRSITVPQPVTYLNIAQHQITIED